MSGVDDIRARLEGAIEELDELMFDRLREASAGGETQRPDSDRTLTRARRSIEKAVQLLGQLDRDD